MRLIFDLFLIIFFARASRADKAADEDYYGAVVDAKFVDYDENTAAKFEKTEGDGLKRTRFVRNFVGTNLFGASDARKRCFSSEDVALLSARRDFESLIPKSLPNCPLDDDLAKIILKYFDEIYQAIGKQAGGQLQDIHERVFYDTLGGYLKSYMLPMAKYSFYAGVMNLQTIESILDLYEECKFQGNTNGNSWRRPIIDSTKIYSKIEPLKIVIHGDDEDMSCVELDLSEDRDEIIQLPRLDPEEEGLLGNIWIPFRRRQSFNLKLTMSSYVLLRYFELTTRCYKFQGMSQDAFNKKFRDWILDNLEVHLGDDVLYPGLGAILRIIESLDKRSKDSIVVLKDEQHSVAKRTKHDTNDSESWLGSVFGERKNRGQSKQGSRINYLTIGVAMGITTVVFLIALIFVLISLHRSKHETTKKSSSKSHKRKPEDEEILLNPRSSSVVSSAQNQINTPDEQTTPATVEKQKPKRLSKTRKTGGISPPQAPKCFRLCTRVSSTSSTDPNESRINVINEKKDASLRKEN